MVIPLWNIPNTSKQYYHNINKTALTQPGQVCNTTREYLYLGQMSP